MAVNPTIQNFADQAKVFINTMNTGVDNVVADVGRLNAKILELQNTPGALTPQDEALLNEIQSLAEALSGRVTALDELTPPAPVTP